MSPGNMSIALLQKISPFTGKTSRSPLSKLHGECGALSFFGLNLNRAPVQHNDLFTETEANAASVLFRTEERDEDLIQQFFGNTRAVVYYLKDNPFVKGLIGSQYDPGSGPVFYGFNGVDDQVDQDLFE